MSAVGIIAEYNPFHNGHAYQIREARRLSDARHVIAIISGDFVQRGAPALMDKYTRTQMALKAGADLVLELPCTAAVSSAETFARCGVSILNGLGVVTHLSFGCEADDNAFRRILTPAARILAEEPQPYRFRLKNALKEGRTFPAAREEALCACLTDRETATPAGLSEAFAESPAPGLSDDRIEPDCLRGVLRSPNNILAIEYLKALHFARCSIEPVPVRRIGDSYHAQSPTGRFTSATALRELLRGQKDLSVIRPYVPESVFPDYRRYAEATPLLYAQDFSVLVHYALLMKLSGGSLEQSDHSDLARRAAKLLEAYTGFDSYAAELKTKDRTLTSVNRFLIRTLLQIQKPEENALDACDFAPYARILGFRKSASSLLRAIHTSARIPVITSLAEAKRNHILSPNVRCLLDADIRAAALYHIPLSERTGHSFNEFRQPLICL